MTVRDAAGNALVDPPVTWSTSDPSGLAVSPTGLLTALANGDYLVTARVNALEATASVTAFIGGPPVVTVSPAPATVRQGATIALTATIRNADGLVLNAPSVTWTSSAQAVATVVAKGGEILGQHFGTVTGVSPGTVTITATSGTASGTASVTVTPAVPVVSVTLSLDSVTLIPQATVRLAATLRDGSGNVLDGRPITWSSDNPAVTTVDALGQVTAVGAGSAAVTATSEGVSGTATIAVRVISFSSVSTRADHTCGLTTDGAAYCWGWNFSGLGDGFRTYSAVPVAVAGGLTFSSLSAGSYHTCGLTASGTAYCWGWNRDGQVGDGSTSSSSVPVAVTGGLTFSAVSAGVLHTCGLTATGAAYCWGSNNDRQLGDGSATSSSVPVAVSGGLAFSAVTAGGSHTCGLTTTGAAYCWGTGSALGVGDTSIVFSSAPVPVAGGLTFSALSAGAGLTCGVATGGTAYCWGLGWDSDEYQEPIPAVPVALPGGPYSAVSAGAAQGTGWIVCALATTGAAYCNVRGLFDAVPGGPAFSAVSVGGDHTCGVSTGAIAYCWGDNRYGQLGNGSPGTGSTVPVKVAGQP